MFENWTFLKNNLWGNTIQDYLVSLAIFAGSVILLTLLYHFVFRSIRTLAQKTETAIDDLVLKILRKTIIPLLYIGATYLALIHLSFPPAVDNAIKIGFRLIVIIQLVRLTLAILVHFVIDLWLNRESPGSTASKSIVMVLRVVVWGLALVFILDNLGFDVNSVIAGLGIGGIAVALAAQTILGDLFNYFVIFFDKPFREGDFIIIDDFLGVIEHIGIKSTRIRSLGGEQLVFSNSDLTSSRLRNYKRMERRRVPFAVGVTYQTKMSRMQGIPAIIKSIIESVTDTVFDRAHFKNFGDFSLNIEVVYYVIGGDYNKYMDIQQEINFKIMEAFEKEGIEFAYPTQTLFVDKS